MVESCLFCHLQHKSIFANDCFYVILDTHPVSPGHALIIAKDHVVSLLDLDSSQWASLQSALLATVNIIKQTNFLALYQQKSTEEPTEKALRFYQHMLSHVGITHHPEGYNIGVNDGAVAGRTIHHLHIQIIPRYTGDVPNPRGGIRHIIPELGDYTSS